MDIGGWAGRMVVMFGAIPLLFFTFLLVAGLVIFLIALVRFQIWRLRQRRAYAQALAAKTQPNGEPYPPAGRGLCDRCGQAFDKVYHLRSGQRLCPACYSGGAP